jgi:hypothetical protein
MKFSHLLEQIEQIFGFLYKHLFRTNDKVISLIASIFDESVRLSSVTAVAQHTTALSGNMLLIILRDTLLSLIPKVDSEIELYQTSVTQSCLDFEKNMNLFGYLQEPSGETKSSATLLSRTVQEIPSRFLEAR